MYSVFDSDNKKDSLKVNCFFDDPVTIARYDRQKHPVFEKLVIKQIGTFWQPSEVDLTTDSGDFKNLSEHEKHIFTSNLKRQILLDSVQGRSPSMAFLPIVSLPELENWIQVWSFNETIHSRSYSHIIRNVYANPGDVFDEILNIQEIVDCAKDISKYYDDLIEYNSAAQIHPSMKSPVDIKEHKKRLWLALNAVNVLEGVRFYVSFCCSFSFAELKKMEGNAKIIKLIANDEAIHLAATQHILKILPQEDEDFKNIKEECHGQIIEMFRAAAEQEKAWAKYLFKDGSMIGLNYELLAEYVEWVTNKRTKALGIPAIYKTGPNPLPWSEEWLGGEKIQVQVANQETENTQYIIGGVKKDVTTNTFANYTL